VAMATEIPFSGDFNGHVLTPEVNTYGGGFDPDGLYYLNTGGVGLAIQGTRIHGTLIVDAGAAKVTVNDAAFLHNYRADYPVLVVNGEVDLALASGDYSLDESTWSTNFNPSGAPYEGAINADQLDTYPNEVRGLVHATLALRLKQSARVEGVVLCGGNMCVEGDNEIIHTSDLSDNPPPGYREPPVMKISQGSWRRVVD
jgi:cytoskeletal protein CcmA (bactofilin family)